MLQPCYLKQTQWQQQRPFQFSPNKHSMEPVCALHAVLDTNVLIQALLPGPLCSALRSEPNPGFPPLKFTKVSCRIINAKDRERRSFSSRGNREIKTGCCRFIRFVRSPLQREQSTCAFPPAHSLHLQTHTSNFTWSVNFVVGEAKLFKSVNRVSP